jgi:hypothetical protein
MAIDWHRLKDGEPVYAAYLIFVSVFATASVVLLNLLATLTPRALTG